MSEIIEFKCNKLLSGVIPEPIPAIRAIPNWYRKMSPTFDIKESKIKFSTVKKCMPVLDSMSIGYIIPLWIDLFVETTSSDDIPTESNKVTFRWNTPIPEGLSNVIEDHYPQQIANTPIETLSKFSDQPMKFISPWNIFTKPGWSCLFTSPLNHFEDRFHVISGVVDTDNYNNNINLPFIWMKDNYEGLIKQGTPIIQVIPFERKEYEKVVTYSDMTTEDETNVTKQNNKIVSVYDDGYRNNFQQKKTYK